MFSQSRLHTIFFGALLCVVAVAPVRADSDDPPGRAARLSYTHGATSFSPAGEDDWVDTIINRPLVSGDRLWADSDGRAEVEVGASDLRLGANTSLELVNLDDRTTQLEVTQGTLYVNLRHFSREQIFEVDTPTMAVMFAESGRYRIDVDSGGRYTTVAVIRGSAVARGDNAEYPLQEGDRLRFRGMDLRDAEQLAAAEPDDFDRFCRSRDERAERSMSLQYVGDDVVGAYDLDEYGSWSSRPEYGHVWYPSHVDSNWAPYSDGHWMWQEPWGWTWVDNAPWGFAPSHYGRWVYVENRWGWVPGPRGDRAMYAPALVVFIGGSGFSIGISIGGGGPIGWFPLGARDVYAPPYRASRDYFTRVNVTNTTINTTNITNVYNSYSSGSPQPQATYANRTVRGAVTAVPANAFINAQPVRAAAVKVDEKALVSAPVMRVAALAPSVRSVIGSAPAARVKPAAAVLERKVVAQTAPPPKPVPFAARQQQLQRSPGNPLTPSAIAALRPAAGADAARNVRVLGPQTGAVNVRKAGPGSPARTAGDKAPPSQGSAPPGPEKGIAPAVPQPERNAPPAAEQRVAPTAPQQERKVPPGIEKRVVPAPPQEERAAAPPAEQRVAPTAPQPERKTPPGLEKRVVPAPPQDERAAPPAEQRAVPAAPQQERKAPPGVEKRVVPAPPQQERNAAPVEPERTLPAQQQQPQKQQPQRQQEPRQLQEPRQQRNVPPASQTPKDAKKGKDAGKKDGDKKDGDKKDGDKKDGDKKDADENDGGGNPPAGN